MLLHGRYNTQLYFALFEKRSFYTGENFVSQANRSIAH